MQKLEQLCLGNNYTTTLHIINSSCVKLSKIMTAQKVYRGVSGGVLPSEFWAKNEWNVAGGVEFAFMSTTLDKEVALHYGGSGGAGLCFEIQMGMVDRGASPSWLSQYPHESEILFAPMTGLEVLGTRVESGVIVVETRLSVNLTALTIEQVVSERAERSERSDTSDAVEMLLIGRLTAAQAVHGHVRVDAARTGPRDDADDVVRAQGAHRRGGGGLRSARLCEERAARHAGRACWPSTTTTKPTC